jgi:hypothetical protein
VKDLGARAAALDQDTRAASRRQGAHSGAITTTRAGEEAGPALDRSSSSTSAAAMPP